MSNENKFKIEVTSTILHIFAMFCMLFDHMWIAIVYGNDWMNCIGRLAMPVFSFMIVEGYRHTGNLKKYIRRMFVFALISEIPFNLFISGSVIYPFHQNVLWTLLIGILCIHRIESAKRTGNKGKFLITSIIVTIGAYLIGMILMLDYNAAGVLTVLVFYFFNGDAWYHRMGQFIGLYYINFELLGGIYDAYNIFGNTFEFPRQGFALFALIPIWLYNGKRGVHSKRFQYFNYAFYPLHLLILSLLSRMF